MKRHSYVTTACVVVALGLGLAIGSSVASAQVPNDAIRKCSAKSNEKERLACFDELTKAGSRGVSEATASTTEYRVVDPDDAYVAPNKYTDKPIELQRMKCFYADKDEYRCLAPSSSALLVFATAVEPAAEKEAIETKCGAIKSVLSPQCAKTIRFKPAGNTQDTIEGYSKRTILITESIEVVPVTSSRRSRRGKRDVTENYPTDWKAAVSKGAK